MKFDIIDLKEGGYVLYDKSSSYLIDLGTINLMKENNKNKDNEQFFVPYKELDESVKNKDLISFFAVMEKVARNIEEYQVEVDPNGKKVHPIAHELDALGEKNGVEDKSDFFSINLF